MKFLALGIAALAGLAASPRPASAAFVTYDSRAAFLAATTVSTEGFEDPFTATGSAPNYVATFDDFTLLALTSVPPGWSTGFNTLTGATSMMLGYSTSGTSPNTEFVTINLDVPATAFGLYVSDFGNFGATAFEVKIDGTTFIAATDPPGIFSGPTFFFGVTSDTPFSSVQLRSNAGGDVILLDDVSVGTAGAVSAVPCPSSATLGMIALAGLALRPVRRRLRAVRVVEPETTT